MKYRALAIAVALGCSSAHGAAGEVEKEFWRCDYAASTRWVDPSEGALCAANFEDLKRTKFNGDYRALLAWWEKNKAAEHQALAKIAGARAGDGKPRQAFGGTYPAGVSAPPPKKCFSICSASHFRARGSASDRRFSLTSIV
jgi:hypothetical protein